MHLGVCGKLQETIATMLSLAFVQFELPVYLFVLLPVHELSDMPSQTYWLA